MNKRETHEAIVISIVLLTISSITFTIGMGMLFSILFGTKTLFIGVLVAIGLLRALYRVLTNAYHQHIQSVIDGRLK